MTSWSEREDHWTCFVFRIEDGNQRRCHQHLLRHRVGSEPKMNLNPQGDVVFPSSTQTGDTTEAVDMPEDATVDTAVEVQLPQVTPPEVHSPDTSQTEKRVRRLPDRYEPGLFCVFVTVCLVDKLTEFCKVWFAYFTLFLRWRRCGIIVCYYVMYVVRMLTVSCLVYVF